MDDIEHQHDILFRRQRLGKEITREQLHPPCHRGFSCQCGCMNECRREIHDSRTQVRTAPAALDRIQSVRASQVQKGARLAGGGDCPDHVRQQQPGQVPHAEGIRPPLLFAERFVVWPRRAPVLKRTLEVHPPSVQAFEIRDEIDERLGGVLREPFLSFGSDAVGALFAREVPSNNAGVEQKPESVRMKPGT